LAFDGENHPVNSENPDTAEFYANLIFNEQMPQLAKIVQNQKKIVAFFVEVAYIFCLCN